MILAGFFTPSGMGLCRRAGRPWRDEPAAPPGISSESLHGLMDAHKVPGGLTEAARALPNPVFVGQTALEASSLEL